MIWAYDAISRIKYNEVDEAVCLIKSEGHGHCKVTVPRPHLIVIHSPVL